MEQLQSVKTMIENLRSEDAEARLYSMRGIHLIATTLGPERTRDELLLYLTDYLDDNDEVLRVFANALGTMLPEVGGVNHVGSLLGPLEMLCSLDEVTVRDEAISSLQNIGAAIYKGKAKVEDGAAKAADLFHKMVQNMAASTPQCRSSACYLIATLYPNVGHNLRASLRTLFHNLCSDDDIMVRRSACIALGRNLAQVMGSRSSDLIPALNAFANDSSDGVRLQAVSTSAELLKVLPEAQHASVLQAVRSLSGDNSWRVRYMTADRIGALASAMAPPDVVRYAVPVFRGLCQDAEAEIRASAVYNMASVLAACRDGEGKKDVLVTGTRLVSDESSHVRMSLASGVLKSVAHVARELWGSTVVPACTALLGDPEADVRLALVSGFSSMGHTAEAKELAPKLIPVVIALAADPKWRLREVVVSQVPYIITSLGRSSDEVLGVCVERLTDRVATIRQAAVQSCCKLVSVYGSSWAVKVLLPQLEGLIRDENYLHRVSLCHLFLSLANVAEVDGGMCTASIYPVLLQLSDDPVANVRLNVAQVVHAMLRSKKVSAQDAEDILEKLKKDREEDVRDFASRAL